MRRAGQPGLALRQTSGLLHKALALEDKRNANATASRAAQASLADMKTLIEAMKLGAQETLDELYAAHLIPFELSARVVESLGLEEYIVRFHDSRLPSIDVSCREDQSFKEVVRRAVLDRVSRMSSPSKYRLAVANLC